LLIISEKYAAGSNNLPAAYFIFLFAKKIAKNKKMLQE
jgi:hypothetical protein